MYDPWVHIRAGLSATNYWSKDDFTKHYVADFESVLEDADLLRGISLLVEDLLDEPGQIWSVNPTKLKRLRDAVEALPERLLHGPLD